MPMRTEAPPPPSDTLEALDAAARAIAGVLDPDQVLQVIVDLVRPLVGARYAALGIVGPGRTLERFVTSGIDATTRARIGEPPRGHGLLGLIMRENRTLRVRDLTADPRRYGFPPHHPEMHSFLGAPVTVAGVSVGNLYLTEKEGVAGFTETDERVVEAFALHAGIAIERARLHDQVRRLALVAERERISQDLHDGIIQSLYAVGLSLEDVPEMMADDAAQAMSRVEHAIEAIHSTIRDIRNFVTGLSPESLEGGDLAAGLQALADEARRSGIGEVRLELDASTDPGVEATLHVLQAAREAVSNAIRHAGPSSIALRLWREGSTFALQVSDDGRGFDPSIDPGSGHHGLANLRARARSLGGDVAVESTPGRGSRVTFRIPAEPIATEASHD